MSLSYLELFVTFYLLVFQQPYRNVYSMFPDHAQLKLFFGLRIQCIVFHTSFGLLEDRAFFASLIFEFSVFLMLRNSCKSSSRWVWWTVFRRTSLLCWRSLIRRSFTHGAGGLVILNWIRGAWVLTPIYIIISSSMSKVHILLSIITVIIWIAFWIITQGPRNNFEGEGPYFGITSWDWEYMPDMTLTSLAAAVALRKGIITKNGLRFFERGENLLQNCILHLYYTLSLSRQSLLKKTKNNCNNSCFIILTNYLNESLLGNFPIEPHFSGLKGHLF